MSRRRAAAPAVAAPQPKDGRRVLVVSHAHPKLGSGGAPMAAYELYRRLRAQPETAAWFLAAANGRAPGRIGARFSQAFGAGEYLYAGGPFDFFTFANRDPGFPDAFAELLRELQPDTVHFHHYVCVGVDAFLIARRTLPDARLVLTLHEFLAICAHYGQMVTTNDLRPCEEASLIACARCFPEHGTRDFFLRQQYIRRFFDLIDAFIAPSRFVADRYVAWGVPAEKMHVIENPLTFTADAGATVAERELLSAGDDGVAPLRIGYFGQLAPFKGTRVLFDAARRLHERGVPVVFDVHGDYSNHEQEFQTEFQQRLTEAPPNLHYRGPYDPTQVLGLMRRVDAVLVPSVWWENSPVVIQEALAARRPVLCSNIGGMAEKVRDGLDGYHFPAGDAESLAALLAHLARHRDALTRLQATLGPPADAAAALAAHLELYARLHAAAGAHAAG